MNKIKNIIIIVIFIILILILSILLLYLKQNNGNNIGISYGDPGETIEITNEYEDVNSMTNFKSVEQCIQKYYNMLNNKASQFYERNDNDEYVKISDIKIKKMRLNLLSEEYINKNNITSDNIHKYLKTMDEQSTVIALKMKKIVNIPVEKYVVHAITVNFDNEILDEFYIFVNLDIDNQTFSIEPILEKYDSIEEIETSNSNKSIEINDNNKYSEDVYNYEKMAKNYFLTYKRLALSKPEILYNYMETEYKNKRFGGVEVFKSYVIENREEIEKLKFTEYLVNNKEDILQFVCKDQYDNLYIFDEITPMQFHLKLDTYTLITDKFEQTYKKSDDIKKVQLNIDKIIKMINAYDYINIYNYLSDGFKENYFRTESEFKEYIKSSFFRYNKVSYKDVSKRGTNIYVATIEVSDLTEESSEMKELSIIIQLNDELDFEMSFSM